jgi:polygalacturonase
MQKVLKIVILLCSVISATAQNYDIKEFGAVADTTKLSTEAIQRAIDSCADNGGGTVVIPAGKYLATTIYLKDNVNLYLSPGSIIYASRKESDYQQYTFKNGAADMSTATALVAAFNANNISITGTGELNCRAERESFRREPQVKLNDSITGREIENAIKYGADYQSKYRKVPPCPGAICLIGCHEVTLRDINVVESSGWGVHIQWCEKVHVDGLNITSSEINGVNSDGLDIDGCQLVTIANCIIDTGDDALCIKTTKSDEVEHPCRNLAITNCILRSSSAALKIGTESHYDFENIAISNCIIDGANRGLNMIVRDGGNVNNVTINNLIINTERKATFWWGNGDPMWFIVYKRDGAASAGSINNVNISNIIGHGQSGVRIEGFDGDIKNITLKDFQLFMNPETEIDHRARNAFSFEKVKELKIDQCSVEWDGEEAEWESAFNFKDIEGLQLGAIQAPMSPNKKFEAIRKINVTEIK